MPRSINYWRDFQFLSPTLLLQLQAQQNNHVIVDASVLFSEGKIMGTSVLLKMCTRQLVQYMRANTNSTVKYHKDYVQLKHMCL